MRQEALPFAYRSFRFRFDGMDGFIRFALSIGRIGRENVESLDLSWLSYSEMEATSKPYRFLYAFAVSSRLKMRISIEAAEKTQNLMFLFQ